MILVATRDAEFAGIVEDAAETQDRFGDDESTGVVVAVVETLGNTIGHLDSLNTTWVFGEPAAE